ncbi:hypothetical protein BH11ACT8_BH11ACT8_06160 [soil metagenome]
MTPPTVPPAPSGRTARRLEWQHLPPRIRGVVETRCGSPVTEAFTQTSGFTPGFASVLVCADGSRHFVKAASWKAQKAFATAYAEEAQKVAALPEGVPAPRLLWTHQDTEWIVLGFQHVTGRAPHRPWRPDDLDACLAMLARTAAELTPAPPAMELERFAVELSDWPSCWDYCLGTYVLPHGAEAATLAARFAEVTDGETVVHTDVRDDNLLITGAGDVLLCDWNWPVAGAPWLDSLFLLIGPRGDGLDVETLLATHPTFAGVPAEAIDIVLALVTGYFLQHADDPVPSSSPFIRDHQLWQGEVCWEWLCERRGWES